MFFRKDLFCWVLVADRKARRWPHSKHSIYFSFSIKEELLQQSITYLATLNHNHSSRFLLSLAKEIDSSDRMVGDERPKAFRSTTISLGRVTKGAIIAGRLLSARKRVARVPVGPKESK